MTFRTRPLFHENRFTTASIRSTPQSPVSSITDSPRSTSAQVVNGKRQTRNSNGDPRAPAWLHRTQPGQSNVRSFEDGTITSSSPTLGSISHKIVFLRHRILATSSDEVVRWAALSPSCNARAKAEDMSFWKTRLVRRLNLRPNRRDTKPFDFATVSRFRSWFDDPHAEEAVVLVD